MLTPVKIGLGFIGMFVLLITFAMSRIPEGVVDVVETPRQDQFDTAWLDVMKPLALKKGDLERQRVVDEPKVVATVPVPVDAVEEEPAQVPPTVRKTKAVPVVNHRHSDICQRHNMRKVTIGKRWRCRKK
jgi:hypothetical protein